MNDLDIERDRQREENVAAKQRALEAGLRPMSLGPISAENFALELGLWLSPRVDYLYPAHERERLNRIVYMKHCNARFSEIEEEIIWSRFCAFYLPALISKFLNPPPAHEPEAVKEMQINNAYFHMMISIQHSPYFWKWLRSSKPLAADNKVLTRVFAERLLAVIPEWDGYMTGERPPPASEDRPRSYFVYWAEMLLGMFSTLLTAYVKNKNQEALVPAEVRARLIPWLRMWTWRYEGEQISEAAGRDAVMLLGDKEFEKTVRGVRRRMKGWEECAMEGCANVEKLKACARCQTVRYCSQKHQREHWNLQGVGHKYHCYQTEY